MTNKQKLKVLVAVLFVFIIILVGLLIYVLKVYNQNNDNPALNTPGTTSPSTTTGVAAPSTAQNSGLIEADKDGDTKNEETISLKFYNYDPDNYDNPKEIVNVVVSKKLYEEDKVSAINKLLEASGLKISKAEVNEGMLTVDLPKEIAALFNMGSAGGITNTNILAMTLLNLPDINLLQVTVDGQPNVEADHFNFNGTFSKAVDGNKYKFASSGMQSRTIEF